MAIPPRSLHCLPPCHGRPQTHHHHLLHHPDQPPPDHSHQPPPTWPHLLWSHLELPYRPHRHPYHRAPPHAHSIRRPHRWRQTPTHRAQNPHQHINRQTRSPPLTLLVDLSLSYDGPPTTVSDVRWDTDRLVAAARFGASCRPFLAELQTRLAQEWPDKDRTPDEYYNRLVNLTTEVSSKYFAQTATHRHNAPRVEAHKDWLTACRARTAARVTLHTPCGESQWQQAASHCRRMGNELRRVNRQLAATRRHKQLNELWDAWSDRLQTGMALLADCSLAALWDSSDAIAHMLPFLPRPKSLLNLKHQVPKEAS